MPLNAGALDRRITLSHRVLARNSQGEQVPTWPEIYATVWAQKIEMSGREFFAAGGILAEGSTRFRIRYRTDVVLTDRLNFDGVDYNISSISEIGRYEGLELFASALL